MKTAKRKWRKQRSRSSGHGGRTIIHARVVEPTYSHTQETTTSFVTHVMSTEKTQSVGRWANATTVETISTIAVAVVTSHAVDAAATVAAATMSVNDSALDPVWFVSFETNKTKKENALLRDFLTFYDATIFKSYFYISIINGV